jgi:hypothetical protein
MAYTLTYSLGTITVVDTTLNNQTSLNLPGRNYAGYGAPVDQNQLSILENFASFPVAGPVNPIPGQTWYDTANKTYNINTSTNNTATWTPLVTNDGNANIIINDITIRGRLFTNYISTGGPTIPGLMIGAWTLGPGSTFNATYADLAERFEADAEYDAGTVVELGGDKEITEVRDDASETVFGVISTTAGYTMNASAGPQKTHPAIAMTGRVPVKVRGAVKKGDRLVSAGKGYARAAKPGEANSFNTLGRSLEDKLSTEDGKVLAAVSAKL